MTASRQDPDAMSASPYSLGHFALGIEGLALLRSSGANEASRLTRVNEIRVIAEGINGEPFSASTEAVPVDTVEGYAAWASTYDRPGNVTIELEQEIVWRLFEDLTVPSVVLDAGCGTGRHSARLVSTGHEVIGVDSSEAMLEIARKKLPPATFYEGDLTRLPVDDESVDHAVCALALSHAADIRPAIGELARAVRPGGSVIVSNPHPFATEFLRWRATVTTESGERAVIPEFPHSHSESIAAFRAAGLEVVECVEGKLSAEQAAAETKAGLTDAFRTALTGVPVVIVWALERR